MAPTTRWVDSIGGIKMLVRGWQKKEGKTEEQGVGAAAASVSNFVDFSFISINKQQHFEWSLDIIATTTTTTTTTTTLIPAPSPICIHQRTHAHCVVGVPTSTSMSMSTRTAPPTALPTDVVVHSVLLFWWFPFLVVAIYKDKIRLNHLISRLSDFRG